MADDVDAPRPTYRFRWTNVDLEAFVQQRRNLAVRLRRDADVLIRRAEQVEEEAAAWVEALETVDHG